MEITWNLVIGVLIGGACMFVVMALVVVNAVHPAPKPPGLRPTTEQRTVYRATYEFQKFQPRTKQ